MESALTPPNDPPWLGREAFLALVDRLIAEARPATMLLVEIERFDALLEVHGFDAAESIARAITNRILAECSAGVTIGRLASNKLGVLLVGTSPDAIESTANALHAAVRRDILVAGPASVAATLLSGGVALPGSGRTALEALAHAREALHLARQKGRDHTVVYEPDAAREATRRANAALSRELVAAIQEDRLALAFQPVVDIDTRRPLFHEALVRIEGRSKLPAGDITGLAERLGLIRLIDRRVLDRALATIEARDDVRLSVNVSAHTVGDGEWLAILERRLAARPDLARRLIVEITETAMIGNLEEAAAFIRSLHRLGCRVAIDDFGAGFTSFRNLRVLDVDIVKIDGTYIEALASRPDDHVFVRALAQLAASFGISVVAEWVQDEATVAILKDLGVDAVQGRLTGDPQPAP